MREEKDIRRETLGVRNIMNTNWPIERVLKRVKPIYAGKEKGRTYWLVYTVCNGTVSGQSQRYQTLREAEENF